MEPDAEVDAASDLKSLKESQPIVEEKPPAAPV